jgi:hypothetical protein
MAPPRRPAGRFITKASDAPGWLDFLTGAIPDAFYRGLGMRPASR